MTPVRVLLMDDHALVRADYALLRNLDSVAVVAGRQQRGGAGIARAIAPMSCCSTSDARTGGRK
jgi:hypothetical protein